MTFGKPIALTTYMSGLLFVALNLTDAWLTRQLIAHGGGEANPIVSAYGPDLAIKGLLALAIVAVLVRLGRARLLKALNIAMFLVVLWTGGWLLTYL